MSQKQIRIFLVDDDLVFTEALKHFLEEDDRIKMDIKTFSSGEECIRHMGEKPDILILDYYMDPSRPNALNGMAVLKKAKSIDQSVRVIILSSQDSIDVAMDTLKYGAFDYVSKTESAFLKIRNSINNITHSIQTQQENDSEVSGYKKANIIIIVVIVILYFVFRMLEKY